MCQATVLELNSLIHTQTHTTHTQSTHKLGYKLRLLLSNLLLDLLFRMPKFFVLTEKGFHLSISYFVTKNTKNRHKLKKRGNKKNNICIYCQKLPLRNYPCVYVCIYEYGNNIWLQYVWVRANNSNNYLQLRLSVSFKLDWSVERFPTVFYALRKSLK